MTCRTTSQRLNIYDYLPKRRGWEVSEENLPCMFETLDLKTGTTDNNNNNNNDNGWNFFLI